MFSRIIFFLGLCVLLYGQEKVTIAVLEMTAEGIAESEARIITSRFRAILFETKEFIVVERDRMNEVLDEQGFQMSGCTSNECAVEAGRLLGVSRIAVGEVGKIGNMFTISVRMIDVETGKLLKVSTEDCPCSIETFLQKTVRSVAYAFVGKEETQIIKKSKTSFYIAPQIGYGFTDFQKFGFGLRSGVTFRDKFSLGIQFAKHLGTDKSYSSDDYYEEFKKNLMYIGLEFGYTYKTNFIFIYPYMAAGYLNGEDGEYYEDTDESWGENEEFGPSFASGGIAFTFPVSPKINIGPELRVTISAPKTHFASFLSFGIIL